MGPEWLSTPTPRCYQTPSPRLELGSFSLTARRSYLLSYKGNAGNKTKQIVWWRPTKSIELHYGVFCVIEYDCKRSAQLKN